MTRGVDDLALMVRCPRCKATDWCLTGSGARATYLHAARVEPIRLAYVAGYHLGLREAEGRDLSA